MREPNIWIGNIGHLLVLIAFASAILSAIGYFISQQKIDLTKKKSNKVGFVLVELTFGCMASP